MAPTLGRLQRHMRDVTVHADIIRPSHVLLHSRAAIVATVVASMTLGLLAGLAHPWLLTVDEPVSG